MALAIFDLDETLISGDSDHAWGEFLISKGLVDEVSHRQKNDAFYGQYKRGELDVHAYLRFACQALTEHAFDHLCALRTEFVHDFIQPLLIAETAMMLNESAGLSE